MPTPAMAVRRYESELLRLAPRRRNDRDLHVLQEMRALESAVRRRIAEMVEVCRSHGASWSEIGAGLGISKQSAQERFGHRLRPDERHR